MSHKQAKKNRPTRHQLEQKIEVLERHKSILLGTMQSIVFNDRSKPYETEEARDFDGQKPSDELPKYHRKRDKHHWLTPREIAIRTLERFDWEVPQPPEVKDGN